MLIKEKVIRRMWELRGKRGYPFDPINNSVPYSDSKILSNFTGTDLSFCQRARKCNFEIWCHPDAKIGHVGATMVGVE